MRVYGYVRVSTKGQAPGTSLDEQTAEILKKYPTAVIVREVASGASERLEFAKVCEQLENGDTLVVCKLDRFCRTAKEGLGYVDYLRSKGVTIHILNMGVIDNSPMGRLMVTMLLAFAEFERALIIERTQTGKAAARSRTGFRDGRPPKFSREQIDHAICLLENHSYKEVTKMTGIPAVHYRGRTEKGETNNEKDYCIRHQILSAHRPLVSTEKIKAGQHTGVLL